MMTPHCGHIILEVLRSKIDPALEHLRSVQKFSLEQRHQRKAAWVQAACQIQFRLAFLSDCFKIYGITVIVRDTFYEVITI